MTGIVAVWFAFVGAALPGVGLARLGATGAISGGGVAWGGTTGGLATLVVGLVALGLQRAGRHPSWRSVGACGLTACAGAWLGAVVGAGVAIGGLPPLPWPPLGPLGAGVGMGLAVWAGGRRPREETGG